MKLRFLYKCWWIHLNICSVRKAHSKMQSTNFLGDTRTTLYEDFCSEIKSAWCTKLQCFSRDSGKFTFRESSLAVHARVACQEPPWPFPKSIPDAYIIWFSYSSASLIIHIAHSYSVYWMPGINAQSSIKMRCPISVFKTVTECTCNVESHNRVMWSRFLNHACTRLASLLLNGISNNSHVNTPVTTNRESSIPLYGLTSWKCCCFAACQRRQRWWSITRTPAIYFTKGGVLTIPQNGALQL